MENEILYGCTYVTIAAKYTWNYWLYGSGTKSVW